MHHITNITITPEILKLIAEIDEFKGRWMVIETLAPEKLTTLRRIAIIESVGSSTRIEGSKLSDADVEKLLSGLHTKSFASRDEEEVAGYADAMDMIFEGYEPSDESDGSVLSAMQVVPASLSLLFASHRNPIVRPDKALCSVEAGRSNSNNCEWLLVQGDNRPNDARIAVE